MIGDSADRLTHLEALEFREKTDMSQIDAENRHIGAVHQFGRTQNRAIATQHHHDLRIIGHCGRLTTEIRRFHVVDDRHPKTGPCKLLHRLLHHRAAFAQTTMRHHHRMPGIDHHRPFRPEDVTDSNTNRTNERKRTIRA